MVDSVTLKVIFSGLVALSLPQAPEEELVAVMTSADKHRAAIYLVVGSCGDPPTCEASGWEQVGRYYRLDAIQDLSLKLIDGVTDSGVEVIDDRSPNSSVPKDDAEAKAISWVPSMYRIIGKSSVARLKESCRNSKGSCDEADARFHVFQGNVSTCHLIHERQRAGDGKYHLITYEIEGHERQAVADAVWLEDAIPGGIVLAGSDGTEWRIEPVDNSIVLIVGQFSEPPVVQEDVVTLPSYPLERKVLGHFKYFYSLARGKVVKQHVPEYPEPTETLHDPGSCEPFLDGLERLFWTSPVVEEQRFASGDTHLSHSEMSEEVQFHLYSVHMPTKCDMATYP